MADEPELTVVDTGVVRVSWSADLQAGGLGVSTTSVRAVVAAALERHHRVETWVHPDDVAGQRLATFSGLRKEGVARGVAGGEDRIVYARLADDIPVEEPMGFRALLNSFLPRKRAISQLLIRDPDDRVLMCRLTYKRDWDLPGGVVEVSESPQLAANREVEEELGLQLPPGNLLLTDWLPPWSGWDDAVCLVFDGGVHDASLVDRIVKQDREIRDAAFLSADEVTERAADFTARRVASATARTRGEGPAYVESGGSDD